MKFSSSRMSRFALERFALVAIGAGVVLVGCRSLSDRLLSDKEAERAAALERLSRSSPEERARIATDMAKALRNSDSSVSNRAVDALVVISTPSVALATEALRDPDPYVRLSAGATLRQIGIPAAPAVAALTAALDDPHPLVREEAALAL